MGRRFNQSIFYSLGLMIFFALLRQPFCFALDQAEETIPINAPKTSATYLGTASRNSVFDTKSYSSDSKTYLTTSHLFFVNYKVTPRQIIGVTAGFEGRPTHETIFTAYNPTVRWGMTNLLNSRTLKLFTDIRIALPLNDEAQHQKMITYIQTTPVISYRQPGSRLSFHSFNRFRYHFYRQDQTGKKTVVYDRSWINYEITDRWNTSFISILQFNQHNGKQTYHMDPWRAGPGFSWEFARDVSVSPYLTLQPLEAELKTLSLFAVLSARFN